MESVVTDILTDGPITLSHTLYDDRGRPFEQRTYNVDEEDGGTYEFTRTWRDDLDRVIGELTPTGFTVNQYDALGRVIATCWWSKQPWTDPAKFMCENADSPDLSGAIELTATQTDYDAFGNVLVSIHYDRLDTQNIEGGAIISHKALREETTGRLNLAGMDATDSNAIVTYTCNWYDAAKRLAATAYFGTNSIASGPNNSGPDSLFENGPAPQYSADDPPIWTCDEPTGGNGVCDPQDPQDPDCPEDMVCNYELAAGVTSALVNRYGYDAAGRRIWSQDPRGIVTRTWHDLLGRTLLVAENWKDFPGTSGPDQTTPGGSGTSNLTPVHTGPIRYTAYHHTRGGLLDMIVAIEPDVPDANITPYAQEGAAPIVWAENAAEDWRATGVEVTGAQVQATQLVYSVDAATGEPIANIVAEVTVPGDSPGSAFAAFPNLVSEIRYPLADTGQPDPEEDVVRITYTPGGQIASRTDQRDVTLGYEYGTVAAFNGGDDLAAVVARTMPSPLPAHLDGSTRRLRVTRQYGEISKVESFATLTNPVNKNSVTFTYDGFGHLSSETQAHSNNAYARTLNYIWGGVGQTNASKLLEVVYPTGRRIRYDYASTSNDDPEDAIKRITGLTELDATGSQRNLTTYLYSGGGRKLAKTLGPASSSQITVDLQDGGLDRFGRTIDLSFEQPGGLLHRYSYTYDESGNRLFDRIVQKSFAQKPRDNQHSYLYAYDALDRVQSASFGSLDEDNNSLLTSPVPEGFRWKLDALGNWSGADDQKSYVEFVGTVEVPYHDQVNQRNQIEHRKASGNPGPNVIYDAAGNLIDDGVQTYVYDAWNRLTKIKRKSDSKTIGQYGYDALNRRIYKHVTNSNGLNTLATGDLFYYDGDRLIETRVAVEEDITQSKFILPVADVLDADRDRSDPNRDRFHSRDGIDPSRDRKGVLLEPSRDHSSLKLATTAFSTDHQLEILRRRAAKTPPELRTSWDPNADGGAIDRSADGTGNVADVPIDGKDQRLAVGPPTSIVYETYREFVWGLDYIDELAAIISPAEPGDFTNYVLQDAGHNIVGLTYSYFPDGPTEPEDHGLHFQFRYHPYGQWTAYEDGIDGSAVPYGTNQSRLFSIHGHQGLMYDQESGLIYNRARYRNRFGTFNSRDPNGQALMLSTAFRSNAQTPAAFVALWPQEQYADSLNPYLPYAANPNNRRDPSGLSSLDYFEDADELELDWYGQRLYTLGAINEGAKWASLGLELTLDIAGGLLGIDVFESVMVLASGRGGFWDSMNIVMAVAPIGKLVKAADKIHSAAKFSRKAKAGMIAVDRARDLANLARRVDKNSPAYKDAVRHAEKIYPKKAGRDEWHHIVPKFMGGPLDGPQVKVNAAYHQWITNEFHGKWKYGQRDVPNEHQLRKFMKEVYDKFPLPE